MAEHNQRFMSFDEWVNKASSWLTRYEGQAICFDSQGRRCAIGGDFMRARDEDAFPVYWLWPDEIAEIGLRHVQGGNQSACPQIADRR